MKLIEVTTPAHDRQFLQVHVDINRHDPNWIRPLDNDIRQIFDPGKNPLFREGEVMRWLLQDDAGRYIGRIAAFTNKKYTNKGDDIPVGGIGFFDCIDNQEAANKLFDRAKDWLQAKGMQAMDGPINFGERNKWWGLLIKGFKPPVYGMNYNPPYYQKLFESYGFQIFYNQLCFYLPIEQDNPRQLQARGYDVHKRFTAKKHYHVKTIEKKNLRQYARDFMEIYNKAWAKHEGGKTISEAKAWKIFKQMKPIIKKYTSWIAYYKEMPIAMWINIPDINQIFRHFNGRLNWWNKLRFLYYMKTNHITQLVGIVYGIVPEYQGTGVDYFMLVEAEKDLKGHTRFTDLEMQWIGDFNPKMLGVIEFLGATEDRRLATYRYLFDRSKEFRRHPMLN